MEATAQNTPPKKLLLWLTGALSSVMIVPTLRVGTPPADAPRQVWMMPSRLAQQPRLLAGQNRQA